MRSSWAMTADILRCRESLRQIAGVETHLFRPPFGVTNPMVARAVKRTQSQMCIRDSFMGVPEKALIAADEIVEYIPQRPPIVMADAFYGIGEDGCARSGLTVCEDNIFVEEGALSECGLIEHIAQSAALRAGYMLSLIHIWCWYCSR